MRLTWYDAIIRICVKRLIFNKLSQLWADVKYHVPTIILFLSGVFRRETASGFILGATWIALVRGWRRVCAVGGMETRFQWRKAHSHTAKCEAFHIAPRLFLRFLILIPLTIRQQCTIYPFEFSTEPSILGIFLIVVGNWCGRGKKISGSFTTPTNTKP